MSSPLLDKLSTENRLFFAIDMVFQLYSYCCDPGHRLVIILMNLVDTILTAMAGKIDEHRDLKNSKFVVVHVVRVKEF